MSTTKHPLAAPATEDVHDDTTPLPSVPASVSVVSALAQCTVSDAPLSVGLDAMACALYANPFAEGAEELLVVDASLRLTQVSRDSHSQWQQQEVGGAGEYYHQVVVATHLDGTPWAFAVTADFSIHVFALQHDSTWKPGPVSVSDRGNWSQLQVQYLRDRPATAWVFATDQRSRRLRALSPLIPDQDDADAPCWVEQTFPDPPAMSTEWVCGWQTPEQGLGNPMPVLRLYEINDERKLVCYPFSDRAWDAPVDIAHDVDGIVGLWFGVDDNLGVLFTQYGQIGLWSPTRGPSTELPVTVQTDFALHDPVAWQDDRGMMHVYGLSGGTLRGAHQTGWGKTVDGVVMPQFLSVFVDNIGSIALTLPLRAGVDHFVVDAYPDTFPTQLMHRPDVLPQDAYSLLTQDTATRWWSAETITLQGDSRRLVDRYQSTVSVTNKYGGPVAGAHVTLTAESRTTVELGAGQGSSVLGPGARIQATTDDLGQVTIRQAPIGLTVPSIRVEVPGVADGATIDAGASVRAFLAGDRTLPNHTGLLTADALENAKVQGAWLVPGWHPAETDDPLPSAADVVMWCHQALSPAPADGAAGWTLDLSRSPHVARDRRLRRHATPDELTAHLEELRSEPSYGGVLPIPDVFIPDLWEGIVEGALRVSKVVLDQGGQDASIFLPWTTEGIQTQYEVVVAMADDAEAAHVIEATFQWIGAGVDRLLTWLSWQLDFKEVWLTATALESGMTQVPTLVKNLANQFLTDLPRTFFQDHEEDLDLAGGKARSGLAAQTFSRFADATTVPEDQRLTVASLAGAKEVYANPHLTWLSDEISRLVPRPVTPGTTPGASARDGRLDGEPSATPDAAWVAFMTTFTASDAGKNFAGALEAIGTEFRKLFDPRDPAALLRSQTADLVRALSPNNRLLVLADTLAPDTKTLAEALADDFANWLATPVGDPKLVELYQWVGKMAGVAAPPPPTEGQLAALQAAFPLTLGFTSAMGQPPFPDGKYPAADGLDDPQAGPPLWVLGGAAPAVMAYMAYCRDTFYNSPAGLVPSGNAPYDGMVTKTYAYTRLLYGFLDVLRLHGIPFGQNVLDSARWARAAGNLFLGLVEMYLAFRYRTTLNWAFGGRGKSLLVFWGLIQMWQSIQVYNLTPDEDIRNVELWDGLLRAFPDATSFTRAWGMSRDLFHYHEIKERLDALAHGFTALNALNGVYLEIFYPVKITPVPDQAVTIGVEYSKRLEVTGGWKPYTWQVIGLPAGLSASAGGLISGTPVKKANQPRVMRVVATVTDSYRPACTDQVTFNMAVITP